MSKALGFLQITARHQDFPFLTVFSIIKTFSKISRPYWRKKAPVNDFVRFPVPRIIAEVKQVMGSFRYYDNSDVIATLMMTNCHLGRNFSKCLFTATYRATFICQDGLCCCNMALISFRLFRKNLGQLERFFWANGLPPPLAKNFPYAYDHC